MFQTKIVGERPRARGRLFFSFLATPILKILIKQVGSPLALRADGMWTALAALGAAGAAAAAGAAGLRGRRVGGAGERRLAKFRQNVARFRLYRLRSLQENMHFAAFFKIYQTLKLNFLKFGKILQILRHLQFFC